jgi:hypothetical protein
MRYVLVLENNSPAPRTDSLSGGDAVTILLPLNRDGIAAEVDRELVLMRSSAERLQAMLSSRGVDSKVIVEWGDMRQALENCLQREEAVLLQ